MNLLKILTSSMLLCSITIASQTPQELFDAKCLMCHKKSRPTDMSNVIAPAIMGVMRHVKMQYSSKDEAISFISDYVLNPQKSKAICKPQKIKRFGLMPSQKGNVTKEEAKLIASWLYDNFPPKGFKGMGQQKRGMQGKAQKRGMNQQKGKKGMKNKKASSPFLITKALPHLSKLLKIKWDDKTLALTKEQKVKLLEVRKNTMSALQSIKPQTTKLQNRIISMTKNGADRQEIFKLIDKLSQLKAKATKIHVDCLINTKTILTPSQLFYLKRG
jgi:cytochrome c